MKQEELLEELKTLKEQLFQREKLEKNLRLAQDNLNLAQQYEPKRVYEFDSSHLAEFLEQKAGEPPKPLGRFNLKRFSKKSSLHYQQELDSYQKRLEQAQNDYYVVYEKERQSLAAWDEQDKDDRINQARIAFDSIYHMIKQLDEKIEAFATLPKTLRSSGVIDTLSRYLEDWRVDNIQEAIQLYFEENWRNIELEKIQKLSEQVKQEMAHYKSSLTDIMENNQKHFEELADIVKRAEENLSRRIDDFDYRLNDISSNISSLSRDIDELSTKVDDLSTTVNDLKWHIEYNM